MWKISNTARAKPFATEDQQRQGRAKIALNTVFKTQINTNNVHVINTLHTHGVGLGLCTCTNTIPSNRDHSHDQANTWSERLTWPGMSETGLYLHLSHPT